MNEIQNLQIGNRNDEGPIIVGRSIKFLPWIDPQKTKTYNFKTMFKFIMAFYFTICAVISTAECKEQPVQPSTLCEHEHKSSGNIEIPLQKNAESHDSSHEAHCEIHCVHPAVLTAEVVDVRFPNPVPKDHNEFIFSYINPFLNLLKRPPRIA